MVASQIGAAQIASECPGDAGSGDTGGTGGDGPQDLCPEEYRVCMASETCAALISAGQPDQSQCTADGACADLMACMSQQEEDTCGPERVACMEDPDCGAILSAGENMDFQRCMGNTLCNGFLQCAQNSGGP